MSSGIAEKVAAALEFADLSDAADRPVHTLSGGVQQRVSLAATLVHEPEVLFLDEPTAGIDPELRHSFWLRFRQLADSGATLVVSTHQTDEVVHCDRVHMWAQVISRLSSMYHANQVLQEIIAGETLATDLGALLALPLYGTAVLALATLTLREQS